LMILLIHLQLHRPISTLFPYTTLFRSSIFPGYILHDDRPLTPIVKVQVAIYEESNPAASSQPIAKIYTDGTWKTKSSTNKLLGRSEEHTSELQSRENLVCRLLLEKKNK